MAELKNEPVAHDHAAFLAKARLRKGSMKRTTRWRLSIKWQDRCSKPGRAPALPRMR